MMNYTKTNDMKLILISTYFENKPLPSRSEFTETVNRYFHYWEPTSKELNTWFTALQITAKGPRPRTVYRGEESAKVATDKATRRYLGGLFGGLR